MKRVIALVLLLSGVLALFAFNVSAATPSYGAYKTNSRQVLPITFKVSALQLDSQPVANTSSYEYEIYIGASVQNSVNTACYINDLSFGLNFGDGTTSTNYTAVDMETYSPDLSLSCVNHTFSVVPSSQFAYGSGIVVPANSTLYLVCKVRVRWNGVSNEHTALNNISVYSFTTNTSDVYTPGVPVDFSPILSYIENAASHTDVNNVLTVLSQFYLRNHDDLQQIINAISYTGSLPSYSLSNGSSSSNTVNFTSTLSATIYRYIGRQVLISVDNEIIESTDNVSSVATVRVPFYITIMTSNGGNPVSVQNGAYESPIFPEITNVSFYLNYLNSNIIENVRVRNNGKMDIFFSIVDAQNNLRRIIPNGNTVSVLSGYLEYPYGTTVTYPTLDANYLIPSYRIERTDYYGLNTYQILRDIYVSMSSDNSGTITSESSVLNNTESQVHQQEQIYFQQNAQAILDTGLSNYRFNTEQSNGISAVSIDFTQLWNALGSWNSVYIFALTLTIALTILRHAPNAISTARRRNYDHNERGS